LIFFDKKITGDADAAVPALSSAALYGKGVFTTVAIYAGKPFLWEKHWRRLSDNADKLGIDLSEFSEESTRRSLGQILEKNAVRNGRARITFFDQSTSDVWHFDLPRRTSLLITTTNPRAIPENFKIELSMNRVSSTSRLAAIKSCNYLENILALEMAKQHGFDEAIRLNEGGEVASACMANVFWLKDGKLFTPSLRTGCLPGTTREFILESLECDEVEGLNDEIYIADSIFLTSAGLGVVCVADFEGRKPKITSHPILELLPLQN
jgi:branched-subunit amino acid aminotransferase/4-amino-4-deoxychorismate lyase